MAANIAEGFRKRRYPNMFVSKLTDSDGEATETQVWLDLALDGGYMSQDNRDRLTAGYEEVGEMLSGMMAHPEKRQARHDNSLLLLLPTAFCLLLYFTLVPSTGYPALFHAAKPPSKAAALSIPLVLSSSTAPALVCSFGQVQ